MTEKRNEFKRDPKSHQLVLTKDNQIPLHHDELNVDYIIELDADGVEGQVAVHYAFDPDRKLTAEEEQMIVEDTKVMLQEAFTRSWEPRAGIDPGIAGFDMEPEDFGVDNGD